MNDAQGLRMPTPVRAGAAYFAAVFAAAFVLGTLRVLVLAPALGEVGAVAVEVPIIVAWSWFVCRRCLRIWPLPRTLERAAMGAVAFLLLILAEIALAAMIAQGGAAGFVRGIGTPAGALGFAGQLVFGAMPLLVLRR